MSEIATSAPSTEGKYMVDAYENWAKAEGPPVHVGLSFDLNTIATNIWPRFGVNGAFCHFEGRCDYLTMWLLDIPAGGKTSPQQHLCDAVFHVVAGRGTATVETKQGSHTFDFGPRAVFAMPMNARYSLKADSTARIAVVSDLRYMLELYRSEKFLFANPGRAAKHAPRASNNAAVAIMGTPTIETDIVADLADVALQPAPEIGTGACGVRILPADGALGIDVTEIPAGAYAKAQRFLPGTVMFALSAPGYTTLWTSGLETEGENDLKRIDWKPGVAFAPGLQMFHQHFNTGRSPARLLAVQYGSVRFPMARDKALAFQGQPTRIEYADQDPAVAAAFSRELAESGVKSAPGGVTKP